MVENKSLGSVAFDVLNHFALLVISLLCLAPMIHIVMLSFSNRAAAVGGFVKFWPVGFNVRNYEEIFQARTVFSSFRVSLMRTVFGTALSMVLTILLAYPLSRTGREFRGRDILMWLVLFAMLFSGGLIPWFLAIRQFKLLNTLWALILPGAVPIWNVIMLMNFFREIPKELEEAAVIDGASHWSILYNVHLPLSLPALATLTLFVAVGHWNAWFDGMLLIMDRDRQPMQTMLRSIVIDDNIQVLSMNPDDIYNLSNRSAKAATILVSTIPILVVYPFLQRYFIAGIRLGAIKG